MNWSKLIPQIIALLVFFACIGAIAAGIDSEFKAIAGLAAGFLVGNNVSTNISQIGGTNNGNTNQSTSTKA